MHLKLSVLLVICLLCKYIGFAQDVHFTLVDPPKEQPWSGITGITQDPEGYLWFATFNGLYKYDGYQYTSYQHDLTNPNSLASVRLESVFADKNGIIWIGTFGAGLDRFDPVNNKFTHYHHEPGHAGSLSNDTVTAIIGDHEGVLWVGTYLGMEKFDPKTNSFKHFFYNERDKGSLSNNQVRVLYEDRQGTIWVGTGSPFSQETPKGKGGLNKFNKKTGKFIRYTHKANDPHSLTDNRVRAIFEDSRGTFWVGTSGDGLHTMDRKSGTFQRYPYDPVHPEKLSRPPLKTNVDNDHITFINEDILGKIWIGTFENGIDVFDPITKKVAWYGSDPKSNKKIDKNEFWYSYKSRDGILWVVPWQSKELYKVNLYQNKLPYNYMGKTVYSFMADTGNTFWMATSKGLVHKKNDNSSKVFYIDKDTSSKNNAIYYIEKDDENKLWLMSHQGLYKFDPISNAFFEYHHQPGNTNSLLSDNIMYLKKGSAGKLWVGTTIGLTFMDTKTATFKHFLYNERDTTSISNNIIEAIETDKNNNVWVGTNNGLDEFDERTMHFKRYLTNNVTIFCLLNDSRGNLWAGTNYGLFKYDKNIDNFLIFNKEETPVLSITEDHEKNLWLKTSKGIIKLNLQNNATNFYGENQGVNGLLLTGGYTLPDGELLYGDTTGYFAFYPEKLLHRTPALTVLINRFLLADIPVLPAAGSALTKPLLVTKEIRLKYNQATFSFGFNNIDFVGEDTNSPIFYILENYDGEWRKGRPDETANYYNVPPGIYTFKVKSINSNGLVSEKGIKVIISPPWWERWWAYVIFSLFILGSIWGFIHYRSLSLLKEKRLLEHKVHIRTEEVLQQKEEIEAQRDDLENAFKELKITQNQLIQSEKMASLGELTSGIAHEIQNPLNFVNNFSEVNTELIDEMMQEIEMSRFQDVKEIALDIKENQKKINVHGKRADSIVKGMLEHSRSGSGQKELKDLNAMADEYMRLSYHGLRAKDKSFNSELITHFDPDLPKTNVIPQDIGRVLLNLFNNAFYAVLQKQKKAGEKFKPEVSVTTYAENGRAVIKIKDNGVGIPDAIKDKIMQPFFTTKPTGEGTGLGLSLTYDMVVKGHGGSITVDTREGEFTEFSIQIPLK